MAYTLEKAEEMARALRALPAVEASNRKLTKQAVVKHLAAEIAGLQQRGYTIEQIVESLGGVGLAITTPTLKSYLQRAKQKAVKGTPAKPRRPSRVAPGDHREARATVPPAAEVKADNVVERSGKQAFLVKDKDSY